MFAESASLDRNSRAHQWVRRSPAGAPNEAAREINRNLLECTGIRLGDPVPDMASGTGVWRPMLERGFSHLLTELDEIQQVKIDSYLEAAFAPFRDGHTHVLSVAQRITSGVE